MYKHVHEKEHVFAVQWMCKYTVCIQWMYKYGQEPVVGDGAGFNVSYKSSFSLLLILLIDQTADIFCPVFCSFNTMRKGW